MKKVHFDKIRKNYPKQSAYNWIVDLAKEMTKRGYFGAEFYTEIINSEKIDFYSWLDMYYLQGLTPVEALDEDERQKF
ncbi:hypothetical protein ACTS9T_12755 [Empedobacter falsenii]